MRQIGNYQLVQEADVIGLNEKEALLYFKGALRTKEIPDPPVMDRATYHRLLTRIKIRRKEMVFTIAKYLPEVHVKQIDSLQFVRKKLFLRLINENDTKLVCDLSKAIVDVERAIAEWNGWTQRITEETLKKFEYTTKEEQSIIQPPLSGPTSPQYSHVFSCAWLMVRLTLT